MTEDEVNHSQVGNVFSKYQEYLPSCPCPPALLTTHTPPTVLGAGGIFSKATA